MPESASRGGAPSPGGSVLSPGGCLTQGGCLTRGGLLPGGSDPGGMGGGCLTQGVSDPGGLPQTCPPSVNRIIDTSKNITLATTLLRPVNMEMLGSTYANGSQRRETCQYHGDEKDKIIPSNRRLPLRSHLHQASESTLRQLCDDTSNNLIEINGVNPEWGCNERSQKIPFQLTSTRAAI